MKGKRRKRKDAVKERKHKRRFLPVTGFTLIELIVVMVLVGIISTGLGMFIRQTIAIWQFVEFRNEVSTEGRKALDWIVRDIKVIKDKDSIDIADIAHIQFDNSDDVRIDYSTAGETLIRNNQDLCDYIQSFSFEYRNKDSNILSPLPLPPGQRKQIRSIKVTISLRKGEQEVEFFSTVFPRNIF